VQLDYSILNREPESEILPYLEERGIWVVVRDPLGMGILTGKFSEDTTFPEGDIRRSWREEQWYKESLKKVQSLKPLEERGTLGQLALRAMCSTIPRSPSRSPAPRPPRSRSRRTRRPRCARSSPGRTSSSSKKLRHCRGLLVA
jgi:aldo/keto reductase family protein